MQFSTPILGYNVVSKYAVSCSPQEVVRCTGPPVAASVAAARCST